MEYDFLVNHTSVPAGALDKNLNAQSLLQHITSKNTSKVFT
jgi:hypothetical protein